MYRLSSSSGDSSSDSDMQSPDVRTATVSDSDPGSAQPGHSQSDADALDSDWETEDESYEDMSDTEFHTPGESEESALFSRYFGRCDGSPADLYAIRFCYQVSSRCSYQGKIQELEGLGQDSSEVPHAPHIPVLRKLSQDIQLQEYP